MTIQINFDGGSRGNPGKSACGFVIQLENKSIDGGKFLGIMTNNQAEYNGMILALEELEKQNIEYDEEIIIYSDSELLVRQINGEYKVKSKNIKPLFKQAKELLNKYSNIKVEHIKREFNKEADKIVNKILNGEG